MKAEDANTPATKDAEICTISNHHLQTTMAWKYAWKLELFLTACKSDFGYNKYQWALLLNCIGDQALNILNNFTYNNLECKKIYK